MLISGRGSNLRAIASALPPGALCGVLSNKAALGLDWARSQGVPTAMVSHLDHPDREHFDAALARAIDAWEPDYVLLAGFMRVLTPGFVARYAGRLINIHPSLLPAFPGLRTHEQALQAGVQWHGCTVHFVTPALDHGPIIAQGMVPVLAEDTPASLAERLLPLEHQVYGEVVRWLSEGRVWLDETQRVQVSGVESRAFLAGAIPPGAIPPGDLHPGVLPPGALPPETLPTGASPSGASPADGAQACAGGRP